MAGVALFEIDSLPSKFDPTALIDAMLNAQFMLCNDIKSGRSFIAFEDRNAEIRLKRAITGIKMHREEADSLKLYDARYMVCFSEPGFSKEGVINSNIADIYRVLGGTDSLLLVSFVPSNKEHVEAVKQRVENLVSSKSIRMIKNLGNRNGISQSSDSMQMELFYESGERSMLLSLLDSLNQAALRNGYAYKVGMALCGDIRLRDYIKSRFFVFEEREMRGTYTLESLFCSMKKADALPLSNKCAASYIAFSEVVGRDETINTSYRKTDGEIEIGEYLRGSLAGSGDILSLECRLFNLGTLISGLPGTGKTTTAMGIIKQLAKASGAKTSIISSTSEWNHFGASLGMKVIRIYGSNTTRLNLFRCDSRVNIERFYENLAMLMASASGAGPYRSSMEKCLLAAFRRAYSSTRSPDPALVYEEIEKAVIEQHGKKSNTGIKYTKHGENVLAALQNLRLMLMKPQFAYSDGEDFAKLLDSGVVFDLSMVSNNMKPFFYALILNQIYSFADTLDEKGNDELRMLICIEEAQLALGNQEESAAALDLCQRIQDFRKRGIGLILITHSITDISTSIRRLCQIKLYFRQSADSAKYACGDLLFREEDAKLVIDKLKSLPQSTCAASFISIQNGLRIPNYSVFVNVGRIVENLNPEGFWHEDPPGQDEPKPTKVRIHNQEGMLMAGVHIELAYLGETIFSGFSDERGEVTIGRLLQERKYTLLVPGLKKRDTKKFVIIGCQENEIAI
ncbi:MAG: hypothetical protein QXF01_00040 [Candidatus Micrarchaeaceae archaeon]